MAQSHPFSGCSLHMYILPQTAKVGSYFVSAFPQQELLCFLTYYWSKLSQKPPPSLKLLPSLHESATTSYSFSLFFFFFKEESESKEALCRSRKERHISPAAAGSRHAALTSALGDSCRAGGVLEAGEKMQHSFGSSTRPGLCSWAAPVRFSSSRIAAKSLPMPEEFPEQHSRSFSNCFETTLSVLQ